MTCCTDYAVWTVWEVSPSSQQDTLMTLTLETNRLLLRQFQESDFDAYSAMSSDPEVMRYIGQGVPMSRYESWRNMATLLGHWVLRGYGFWAVEEKSSGELIGRCGIWNPEGWPGIEVGWIFRRSAWGQGSRWVRLAL